MAIRKIQESLLNEVIMELKFKGGNPKLIQRLQQETPDLQLGGKEWTDQLVVRFAKDTNQGSYGKYQGCPKVEDKLKVFKQINHIR